MSMTKCACRALIPVVVLVCIMGISSAYAETATPASRLVGVWLFRSQDAQIKVTFTTAGRFTRTMKTVAGEETTQGKYSIVSGNLTVRPDGDSEVVRLKFRFVDNNQLELIDQATSAEMTRYNL